MKFICKKFQLLVSRVKEDVIERILEETLEIPQHVPTINK